MKRYSLLFLMAANAMLCGGCAQWRHARPAAPAGSSRCGPGLTDVQILDSAKRALRALWGREPVFDKFRVSIESVGCDYVFRLVHPGVEAREDISLLIDRAGRVKTVPICCDLGDCPEYCAPTKPSETPPASSGAPSAARLVWFYCHGFRRDSPDDGVLRGQGSRAR